MRPRQRCRGNLGIFGLPSPHHAGASMRPRQRCRGNQDSLFHISQEIRSFNEAAAALPRKSSQYVGLTLVMIALQ